ncbi:ABC transporter permease subunit [Desulfoluna butyratoxydans]|uniref:Abc-2 family transporter protein n=1 Tax=Desulfoluna butyratoxydans TaxID=231438 RepID=A0A4V6ILF6_9BACT|nr:ABC transporter permease subunit [Desulfoluna butyratoxydans]VFQ44918.1 abc-2 family transporter protein [Desulfoluna butyratoxydans]
MQTLHIMKKELKDFFTSPIAYIVIAIFLLVTGWFFFLTFFLNGQASLRDFFALLPLIFSFVIPAVTMRLFAEELAMGSFEVVMTLPVTPRDIVVGKFLSALVFVCAMLTPTFAYAVTVALFGDLDWGPVIGGYAGAILLGGAFAAIGLFASSLTRNQIIAFILGTLICFALTLVDKLLVFFPTAILGFFSQIGADYHFRNIARGVVDSRDLLYFGGVIFLFLYGASISVTEKN